MGRKILLELDYADENVSKVNDLIEVLEAQGARIGLEINVKKIKSLRLGTSED
jgi:hypothetical protein